MHHFSAAEGTDAWLGDLILGPRGHRHREMRKRAGSVISKSGLGHPTRQEILPVEAIQILQQQGIIVDKYVLPPQSVNLFVPLECREAAVSALHSLI
jgi:aspartate kinase